MLRAGAAVLALVLCAGAAMAAADAPKERSPEKIYATVCGYCHGRNVGPILLGRHLPAETIAYVARHGQNGMPAFRPSEITPAELGALAAWISRADASKREHGQ